MPRAAGGVITLHWPLPTFLTPRRRPLEAPGRCTMAPFLSACAGDSAGRPPGQSAADVPLTRRTESCADSLGEDAHCSVLTLTHRSS